MDITKLLNPPTGTVSLCQPQSSPVWTDWDSEQLLLSAPAVSGVSRSCSTQAAASQSSDLSDFREHLPKQNIPDWSSAVSEKRVFRPGHIHIQPVSQAPPGVQKRKPFACDQCPSRFTELGNLVKHVRGKHEKPMQFKCDQCEKVFPFRDGLTRHVQNAHEQLRPHQCHMCSMRFKQRVHLTRHVKFVHLKLRPMTCYCGESFREAHNLRKHQRSAHGDCAISSKRRKSS